MAPASAINPIVLGVINLKLSPEGQSADKDHISPAMEFIQSLPGFRFKNPRCPTAHTVGGTLRMNAVSHDRKNYGARPALGDRNARRNEQIFGKHRLLLESSMP